MRTFSDANSVADAESRHTELRTVDVARRSGYSAQQIRKLESDGVLPPARRAANGYRAYTPDHVLAATAYRELAAGLGPVEAKRLTRIATSRREPELLTELDAAHARLHRERRELALAKRAVADIAAEPLESPLPSDAMTITELAEALGLRTSTLRHWDAEGLVVPSRAAPGRTRTYSPEQVRDARITHQLRLAGYRVDVLRELLPRLGHSRGRTAVATGLHARDASITARSRALLAGSAALSRLLDELAATPRRIP